MSFKKYNEFITDLEDIDIIAKSDEARLLKMLNFWVKMNGNLKKELSRIKSDSHLYEYVNNVIDLIDDIEYLIMETYHHFGKNVKSINEIGLKTRKRLKRNIKAKQEGKKKKKVKKVAKRPNRLRLSFN